MTGVGAGLNLISTAGFMFVRVRDATGGRQFRPGCPGGNQPVVRVQAKLAEMENTQLIGAAGSILRKTAGI
jgi:hypothetical protein